MIRALNRTPWTGTLADAGLDDQELASRLTDDPNATIVD